jgi:sugar-specific transcriptional regulator TrmB
MSTRKRPPEEAIATALNKREGTAKELARRTGLPLRDVYQALGRLQALGVVDRRPRLFKPYHQGNRDIDLLRRLEFKPRARKR